MYFLQKVTEKVVDFRKISSGIFLNSDSRLPPCKLYTEKVDNLIIFELIIFMKRVTLELTVCDYDRIGTSDPIGKVSLGYNRKGAELKHWKEMVENPRRPVIHWHVLKVHISNKHVF